MMARSSRSRITATGLGDRLEAAIKRLSASEEAEGA
jgi:hypothetical protein